MQTFDDLPAGGHLSSASTSGNDWKGRTFSVQIQELLAFVPAVPLTVVRSVRNVIDVATRLEGESNQSTRYFELIDSHLDGDHDYWIIAD